MGSTGDLRGYCPRCDAEQRIQKTVPWQADFCAMCGTDSERPDDSMTISGTPDGDRTMQIRFRRGDGDGRRDAGRARDRGDAAAPHLEVGIDDPDDLDQVTRPETLNLLRTLVQHDPDHIRDVAGFVDRDVQHVHTTLEDLAALQLIEFDTDGRRKRPTVWYDSIEIELPLDTPDVTPDSANASAPHR